MHKRYDPSSLSSDRVRCMILDGRGILWVGTANGLDLHAPEVWRMHTQNVYADPQNDEPDLTFHGIEGTSENGVRIFTSEGFFTGDERGILHREPVEFQGRPMQPTTVGIDHNGRTLIGRSTGSFNKRATARYPRPWNRTTASVKRIGLATCIRCVASSLIRWKVGRCS